MKKAFLLILSVFVSIGLFLARPAFAQEEDTINLGMTPNEERIELFEIDLTLQENTDIHIREKIHYSFSESKRGIYRVIPVNKRSEDNVLKFPTTIKINSVKYYPANQGAPVKKVYEKSSEDENIYIRIGEEDKWIDGLYVYELDYVVKNGINYFENHDELYWNIIGTGWEVPIDKVVAKISLPGEVTKSACYTGIYGSTESNCELINESDTSLLLNVNTTLEHNNAVTIAVEMPKGSVEDAKEREEEIIKKNNLLGLLSLILIPLSSLLIQSKLKSPKKIIVPDFTPPRNINPLMAGSLLTKGGAKPNAITAEIINLAIAGHLVIEQVKKKEYLIKKVEKDTLIEYPSSQKLYNSLFASSNEINTKNKNTSLGVSMQSVFSKVNSDLKQQKYINEKKSVGIGLSSLFGVIALVSSLGGMSYFLRYSSFIGALALLLTGIVLFILPFTTDSRSNEGNDAYYKLLGLKMYINTAEKHRIEFHNDPEKYIGVFEKLLPYAILFGLEKKWVKEFEDIYTTPPDWYQGDISTFNALHLVSSVSSINSSITAHTHQTGGGFSSGGSGFSGGSSGGGGGGGGGGSW